jgi:hypothetical protein
LFSLFATGVVDTVSNLPPVSTTSAVPVAKFATSIVDTGSAPSLANISENSLKI